MGKKLRVAMIGAGNLSTSVHYPSLDVLEDVEIAAVSELDEARMNKAREQFKIPKGYKDYKAMIEEVAPDAVYLVMPPQILFPHALRCLEMGVNLFIEKPPGLTVDQTRHLARKAESKGLVTMCGFQRRHAPLVVPALEEARRRGGVDLVVASFYKWYDDSSAYFNGEVDILTSDCIHAVDLIRYAGGEVKQVASDVRNRRHDYPNFFTALITFESGATGVLLGNWSAGARFFTCEIHARAYTSFINVEVEARSHSENGAEPLVVKAAAAAGGDEMFKRGGFLNQNRVFMDCVREKGQPPNSIPDSVKSMELVERIYREVMK
ncbi:MAG: Gfo/Idh/MocA family oxidoreductase [Planctomycetota bacterium]|nr:Gfo/Idh/MocA family oxidoreductase [Planctomycetota bacterium]